VFGHEDRGDRGHDRTIPLDTSRLLLVKRRFVDLRFALDVALTNGLAAVVSAKEDALLWDQTSKGPRLKSARALVKVARVEGLIDDATTRSTSGPSPP